MSVIDLPSVRPPQDQRHRCEDQHGLSALQLGMGWFPETGNGGLDRYFHDLLLHLPSAGVRCRGLVTGSPQVERASVGQHKAFAAEQDRMITRLRGVRRAVNDAVAGTRFDVVASHFALYAYPVLRRLSHLPLVVHFQGPWSDESRAEGQRGLTVRLKERLESTVYRRASRLIVLTDAFGRLLVDLFGVAAERVRVVPPGVDLARFHDRLDRFEARRHLNWPTDRPIVLAVRRLVRRMGLDNLIDAVRHLRERVPDVLLMIAGRGPMRQELSERIASAGLSQHVRLLGFVPDADLPLAYRAADLTVVPTVSLEGFGLIAAESLAAGTPALVTPVAGLPEVVRPLSESLVLPGTDPAAIAAGLGDALTGRRSLPDAGACRAYAEGRFSWTTAARRVRDVYAEAAGVPLHRSSSAEEAA